MSTSGSFTPPANPCPTNVFTRAALLALRTAGTLRPECHYLVTGPVIGTAGNTSPTTIELHAVSPTELALEAKVHTTFSDNAWEGLFNIDSGTVGSIIRLVGDWNNVGIDTDPDSPTVHTQIPWHKGSNSFRDNVFRDSTLTGLSALGGGFVGNNIEDSDIDVTGITTARIVDNQIVSSTIELHAAQTDFQFNQLTLSRIVHVGTGTTSMNVNQNAMIGGSVDIDAASTAAIAFTDNIVGGTANGYRIVVEGKTGGSLSIQGNRFFNRGAAAQELRCAGPAVIEVSLNEITGGSINADGTGFTIIEANTIGGSVLDQTAPSAGDFTVTRSQITNTAVTVGAANVGPTFIDQSTMRGGVLDLRGPVAGGGRNDFVHATILDLVATVAATATAGIKLEGGLYDKGVVNQNRTAGTASTILNECTTSGIACVITDNGTTDPGQAVTLDRVSLRDSAVTLNNIAAGRTTTSAVSQMDMTNSLMFVSALPGIAEVRAGRMLSGNLTVSADLRTFTLDGLTKVVTVSQANRAANPGFDNYS